ncbi:MAG TPA: HAD family hydrolase [Candidatus Bathyarchaeia archaeon]|nr:HAD family hydrolase [Candidatus Bathyarchaeia archaeon]
MSCTKAVIFDYVGTLVNCKSYTMEASRFKLYKALFKEGFDVTEDSFVQAYALAHEKYRKVRYEQLREVTNAIWVAEALSNLGFQVTPNDSRVKAALNVFFQDFIDTLELREGAKDLIKKAQTDCKVGLITNFTYAPVIYNSLRNLGISTFFNAVEVSEENGWRKPSSRIFQEELKKLHVHANEAIYIGDSPIEDIKGAKEAGLKTVFVPSQFNSLKDLLDSQQKPDFIASDLSSVVDLLEEIHK